MRGMIAGQGRLPELVFQADPEILVCALEPFLPDTLLARKTFRLETLGTLLRDLRQLGVDEVCFAGAIRRPAIDPQRIDCLTRPLVARLMGALAAGDDGALSAVASLFEESNIRIIAPHDIAPDLLACEGVLSTRQPPEGDAHSLQTARDVVDRLGVLDVGQGVVVASGKVLVIEGYPGTDWMLHSLMDRRPDWPEGGFLFKAAKPDQDLRFDVPSVGPSTAQSAAKAGLDGIIVQHERAYIIDREALIEECDALNLFLMVCP